MPDWAMPLLSKAAPEASETSSNVPSPRFRKRKCGFMSLATYRSIRPSSLRSAATTPKPWPSLRGLGTRLRVFTSTIFFCLVAGSISSFWPTTSSFSVVIAVS